MTPLNPIVEALVGRLDANLREAFEETAGVVQFEAGKPRELAEALALLDVLRQHPLAVTGLTHMRMQFRGEVVSVLTTNPDGLRKHLGDAAWIHPDPIELTEAVERLGIGAVLGRLG
jgi:hypothetical protein